MGKMREQAARFGAEFVTADATKVDLGGPPFRVWVDDQEFSGKALIVATGAKAKMLGLEEERRLLGHGVSTCATCDGFFFRDRELVVVGGGDSALEEATFLTRFATKVTVVHRRDRLRASKVMQDRAFANPKVEFAWNSAVVEVLGQGSVSGVKLRNLLDGSESELPAAGMFVAIGHTPNTELFAGQLDLDEQGYVLVRQPSTETSVSGVFAAGDVVDHTYRQRSPRPARAVPPRSTPSAGWRRTGTTRAPPRTTGNEDRADGITAPPRALRGWSVPQAVRYHRQVERLDVRGGEMRAERELLPHR